MYESKEEKSSGDICENLGREGIVELDSSLIEFGELLGNGGVGMTYEGFYDSEAVALKRLFDPRMELKLRQEFMDEVLVLSSLSHPNIVKFLGAVTSPPNLCFAMELCDASLFHVLHEEKRRMSAYRKVEIAAEVAEALSYLHARSPPVLHRDLKSHNVLLTKGGSVKLCDFGLSKSTLATAGTPSYMAPELLRGASFGVKVDVYALGILMWEIVAQQVPFGGLALDEIRQMVLEGERPDASHLDAPDPLVYVIEDATLEEPQKRPTARHIVDELWNGMRSWQLETSADSDRNADHSFMIDGGDALDALIGK
eukprot:scaffold427_cov263-Pinguiococcus_pyrenoidosus.AAC.12